MISNCVFDINKPIAIGADHAGFELKEHLKKILYNLQFNVQDFGTDSPESVDYPDFAHPVSYAVETNETAFGILICGSANGVAITANKHSNIRAAICWIDEIALMARKHNDANIICIPARFVEKEEAEKMVVTFMSTGFEGGRHLNRVNKITLG